MMFLQQKILIKKNTLFLYYQAPKFFKTKINKNNNIQKIIYTVNRPAPILNFNFYIVDSFTSASLNMQLAASRYKHRLGSFV